MENYNKPLPVATPISTEFWKAAHEGRLQVQYCDKCKNYQFFPRHVCGSCWGEELEWNQCSGKGHVFSYSICHFPADPRFKDDVPYVVAIVELDEGVKMTTNIVGCAVTDVHVGMRVEVVFDQVTDEISLVKFRPVK